MRRAVALYNGIAESLRLAADMLPHWIPARAAITEVCGVEWDGLNHGKRTLVGSTLRDWFADDFPEFALTPIRLLGKSNGKGSHMIAVYPLDWLIGKRTALLALIGIDHTASSLLPFFAEPRDQP